MTSFHTNHLHSVFFAPRGGYRMAELGNELSQRYLRSSDNLIGIIGDAGSGKSMLIKGMFPGLELTNDDEGVNIRPLPLLDLLDDPLSGYGFGGGRSFRLFATPHTYHIDIRFEQGFTPLPRLAESIMAALDHGKRVVVEHFELVYPFLKTPDAETPRNADLLIGVGEEVMVTRPNIFGPLPEDIAAIVHKSIRYRKMAHSAEDITEYFLPEGIEHHAHSDVKHGFVLCFLDKPDIDIEALEKKVKDLIAQDIPITFHDEQHIRIGDAVKECSGPRNHVRTTGQIEGFTMVKHIPFDPVSRYYMLIGLVGQTSEIQSLYDLDKIERTY